MKQDNPARLISELKDVCKVRYPFSIVADFHGPEPTDEFIHDLAETLNELMSTDSLEEIASLCDEINLQPAEAGNLKTLTVSMDLDFDLGGPPFVFDSESGILQVGNITWYGDDEDFNPHEAEEDKSKRQNVTISIVDSPLNQQLRALFGKDSVLGRKWKELAEQATTEIEQSGLPFQCKKVTIEINPYSTLGEVSEQIFITDLDLNANAALATLAHCIKDFRAYPAGTLELEKEDDKGRIAASNAKWENGTISVNAYSGSGCVWLEFSKARS